jgi:tRNA G10  N-methylase Trm11
MPTYVFISGKNWTLSLAELTAYFTARNTDFKIEYFCREYFTINFTQELDAAAVMDDLGGTIKIGAPKSTIPSQTVKEAFLEKNKPAQKQIAQALTQSGIADAITAQTEKLLFGVSVYFTDNAYHP